MAIGQFRPVFGPWMRAQRRDVAGGLARIDRDRRLVEAAAHERRRVVAAAAAAGATDPGSGLAAVLVAVVRDDDLVVLAVEEHAVRIAEPGLRAADHPQRRVGAAGALRVDDDLARPLDADRDFLAHRVDRQPPGLVRHAQRADRLDVAVGVVRKDHHPVADVVVDRVDLPRLGIDGHGGDEHHAGRRSADAGERRDRLAALRRRAPVVRPERVAVGIAHEDAVVHRIDGDAVQRRVRDRHTTRAGGTSPPAMCAAAQSGQACGARRRRRQVEAAVVAFEREQPRVGDERAKRADGRCGELPGGAGAIRARRRARSPPARARPVEA